MSADLYLVVPLSSFVLSDVRLHGPRKLIQRYGQSKRMLCAPTVQERAHDTDASVLCVLNCNADHRHPRPDPRDVRRRKHPGWSRLSLQQRPLRRRPTRQSHRQRHPVPQRYRQPHLRPREHPWSRRRRLRPGHDQRSRINETTVSPITAGYVV